MRKKTQEEYEAQVKERAPHIIVRGKYSKNRTPIEHYCLRHNISWDVSPFNFLQHPTGCEECQQEILNIYYEKRRKTDEQFFQELNSLESGIKALGEYKGSRILMPFECKYGHIWTSAPHDILEGYGCPYCSGQSVLRGYNDLWTTNPDVAKMLADPNVGYEISRGSNREVEWICPNCGKHKISSTKQVINFGLACNRCSDKISYPNKFIRELLFQIYGNNFTPEWSPEWIGRHKYDAYFEKNGIGYAVEMDGGIGHGNIDFITRKKDVNGISRDIIKDKLASEHNIIVIRIDCNYKYVHERFEYIKNSIINSKLSQVLDLDCVDWGLCNRNSLRSYHREAARQYDSGVKIREIADNLCVSYSTIYNWLKSMAKEGLCSYNPEYERHKRKK